MQHKRIATVPPEIIAAALDKKTFLCISRGLAPGHLIILTVRKRVCNQVALVFFLIHSANVKEAFTGSVAVRFDVLGGSLKWRFLVGMFSEVCFCLRY